MDLARDNVTGVTMAAVDFTVELDTRLVSVAVRSAAATIAAELRKLPRVTETDGSRWVSSELLDEMAAKLEAIQ